jgi:hypothetical protein
MHKTAAFWIALAVAFVVGWVAHRIANHRWEMKAQRELAAATPAPSPESSAPGYTPPRT